MTLLRTIVAAALFAAAGGSYAKADEKPAPPPADKAPAPAAAAWKAGDKVDVEWNKKWWKAVIVEAKSAQEYKIHYLGYKDAWDEVVAAARIRARTADSKKGEEISEKD